MMFKKAVTVKTPGGVPMSNQQPTTESYAELEKRIRSEILVLFEEAIAGQRPIYRNKNMSHCWDAVDDDPCRCKAVEEGEIEEYTMNDLAVAQQDSGSTIRPYSACQECAVFKDVCPTVVEELGEAFNTLLHKMRASDEVIADATTLTRSLASSLENMDFENKVIREQMITDPLTGLYNRHHMNDSLLAEVERCHNRRRHLCLVMLDLDDFKTFNDTYGHLEGDKVLSRFGRHLKSCLREYDTAFRYGGEEFLIMLPDTMTDDARLVAERIRRGFADIVFNVPSSRDHVGGEIGLTVSGGLVEYKNGMGAIELLEIADQSLYAAKRQGKNQIHAHSSLVEV
jgi:diguanylate cyclase (GGDEF)-like protein